MPVFVYTRICEINDNDVQFIGCCKCIDRDSFDKKVDALCIAMDWDRGEIKITHTYLGVIYERFDF